MGKIFYLLAINILLINNAWSDLRPARIHLADTKKTKVFIHDGLVVGGDRAINGITIKDIRRANNSGFERVVIDLDLNHDRQPASTQRPPYYQISVAPDEKRLILTLWGNPRLGFDPKKVVAAFKKSSVIQNVTLLPRLEEERWTFILSLKGETPVEVFELSNPVRVILDIQHKKG